MRHLDPLSWRILLSVINWAALAKWIGETNWLAVSTTIGAAIFNISLGYAAARNHLAANRLKIDRERDEVMRDSLTVKVDTLNKMLAERDYRISDLIAQAKSQDERFTAERKGLVEYREEINRDAMGRISEVNELRKANRELGLEIAQLRREIEETRRPAGVPTNNDPAREKTS